MNLLKDIITYVRRIIKSPSNAVITDSLIIDYINRFWLMDVDARIQVFDLKTKYQFVTQPGVDQYNMPLYDTQTEIIQNTETQIVLSVQPFTDGTALYFEDLLSVIRQQNPTITLKPGTVVVYIRKGQADQSVYQDDGSGVMNLLSGTYTISSGTVDYNTGIVTLNFTVTPVAALPVLGTFIYISTQFGESVAMFPVYQGFLSPVYINNVELSFHTERNYFDGTWPGYSTAPLQIGTGNGTTGPYTLSIPLISQNPPFPNFTNPPFPNFPISSALMRGHVDIAGIISTGNNVDPPLVTSVLNYIETIPTTSVISEVFFTSQGTDGSNIIVQDSGEFLLGNTNLGLLMEPGKAPYGNRPLTNGYTNIFAITGITQANPAVLTATTNFSVGQTIQITGVGGMVELNDKTFIVTAVSPTTVTINVNSSGFTAYTSGGTATSFSNLINYLTGVATNVFFPQSIPDGMPISAQCRYYQLGIPRSVLFYNNILKFRSPPNTQYVVDVTAYLTPAAFFNTSQAIPFAYMGEYIARGAARKILSDVGDTEQFQFYEQFFLEQESLVHIRSQRQWTATRSQTIYSMGANQYGGNFNNSMFGA